ncbi:MAG: CDC27 family protein [Gammaproteobacteria bacterium]|nr:CDC27 family protein [Gammaproteobacteria bacterium]
MSYSKMFEEPSFNWNSIYGTLNPNVIAARSPDNRPNTLNIIETFSHQLSQQLHSTTPIEAGLASDTCAHTAWIFILERNRAEAQKHISFALKFASTGFARYVESTVKRGAGDFKGAFDSALAAIDLFKEAEESNLVLAHAHIQVGLAALRLNQNEVAKQYFEAAEKLALEATPSVAATRTYAEHVIMRSEGNPMNRMLMNLAQVYNKLGQYNDALRCLNQIPPPESPIQIAYSNNVFAETYIGLQQYDEAKQLLAEAYAYYETENMLNTDNNFRNMLGSLEVNLALNEPLEHLEATRALYKTLKYAPDHDFRLRLDAIVKTLKHQAEGLITSEQYDKARPLLHEVYCHYLDVLEVNLELGKPSFHLEETNALHAMLAYEPTHELTQRLDNIKAKLEEPIGLDSLWDFNPN